MASRQLPSDAFTVLVSPDERDAIEAKAAELQLTPEEVLRMAFRVAEDLLFTPGEQHEFELLLQELHESVARTSRNVEEAVREVAETRAEIAANRKQRSEAHG